MGKKENNTKNRLVWFAWGALVLWLLNFVIADTQGIILAIYTALFIGLPILALVVSIVLKIKWKTGGATIILSLLALTYLAIGLYMVSIFD